MARDGGPKQVRVMTGAEAVALGAHCHMCPLRGGVIVGPQAAAGKLRLVIVGEGPGRHEEKLGTPFVGFGGALLDATLGRSKFSRRDAHLTTAALCRGETDKENAKAAECCAPRLLRELQNLPPDVPILSLGAGPTRSLLGVRRLLYARGFIWSAPKIEYKAVKALNRAASKATTPKAKAEKTLKAETLAGRRRLAGRMVFPSVSTGFVVRADTWAPIFRLDVARALRWVTGGPFAALEDTGKRKVGGVEVLRGLGAVVSCDVETDGVKPLETKMLCLGLSDGVKTRVIWPWRPSYAKRVARFLAGRRGVVFHNGHNFDLMVLANHGVTW